MTRLEYVCTHVTINNLSKEARDSFYNGTPLGDVIISNYCPQPFGISATCVADSTSCTNCWNEEYRGA